MNKGFTLFMAIVITGTLLLVSAGIVNLAVKGSLIYSAARLSQHAFYAADTGIECAIYWDAKNPSGVTAFRTAVASTINCNQNANNPANTFTVGGPGGYVRVGNENRFTIEGIKFLPDPYCVTVVVTKYTNNSNTKIESYGHNTCDETNPRRVERAVRVRY